MRCHRQRIAILRTGLENVLPRTVVLRTGSTGDGSAFLDVTVVYNSRIGCQVNVPPLPHETVARNLLVNKY